MFCSSASDALLHRYLVNSLFDLKSSLRARNSDLSLWAGLPEVVVPQLVRQLQAGGDRVEGVWFGKEVSRVWCRLPPACSALEAPGAHRYAAGQH